MTLFSDWTPKWFGLWRTAEQDASEFPLLEALVDVDWNPVDRQSLIRYLASAQIVLASPHAINYICPVCGEGVPQGDHWSSDGVWLWPSDLHHSVEAHGVRLSDQLAQHIRLRNYLPPDVLGVPIEALPWPQVR